MIWANLYDVLDSWEEQILLLYSLDIFYVMYPFSGMLYRMNQAKYDAIS